MSCPKNKDFRIPCSKISTPSRSQRKGQDETLAKGNHRYCAEPKDETKWAMHVFLGVNRDLSCEPSALVMLLEKPLTIAGHVYGSLEMQIYGFDKTRAPEGKGVIKVELVSRYSYWKKLHADRQLYSEEKQKVAEQVIDALEEYFKGIKGWVEVIDVPTLMT